MADLIVGDDDCKYIDIIKALEKSPAWGIVINSWKSIARNLSTPEDKIKSVDAELSKGTTYDDAFWGVLTTWRARESQDAKLSKFISVLESCQQRAAADALRDKFNVSYEVHGNSSAEKTHGHQHKKFTKLPTGLEITPSSGTPLTIIKSLDCDITKGKLREKDRMPLKLIAGPVSHN